MQPGKLSINESVVARIRGQADRTLKALFIGLVSLSFMHCGHSDSKPTTLKGTSSQDQLFKSLRHDFGAGKNMKLDSLTFNKSTQCIYQWGVKDQFVTGRFDLKFVKVPGLSVAEMNFEDASTVALLLTENEQGQLFSTVREYPGVSFKNGMMVYFRKFENQEAAFGMEWTINPDEFFRETSSDGRGIIDVARYVTDPSLSNPERQVVFYANCMGS
ncbi:MAG: hypothetical protein NT027_17375 [Proteobacteria bacterium]|nr:hypothetical protein [Pseudomonadota bacterium]